MKQLLVFLMIFFITRGLVLAESADQRAVDKTKTKQPVWLIQDELSRIENTLGYKDTRNVQQQMDQSQIQNALNKMEQALDVNQPKQPFDAHDSLRKMDDSLNSLKLDELSRIEQRLKYDNWIQPCLESNGCVEQQQSPAALPPKTLSKPSSKRTTKKTKRLLGKRKSVR